ncbi:MAG: hypothetical protein AB8B64_08490 [Granulosicoccus sp.]
MNSVTISVDQLRRSPRAFGQSATTVLSQRTCFADLPLPARLLLAVPRIRGLAPRAQIAQRYVLDTLGRIIDAGPQRRDTIEAVNLLSEVLQMPSQFDDSVDQCDAQLDDQPDSQWLSAMENMVLCVLCKIRSGQTAEAGRLTQHWLTKTSVHQFNAAAEALCDSDCFKKGGAHVFTPAWSGPVLPDAGSRHRSVSLTKELALGESLMLNTIRLRMRTLPYTGISTQVVPMLREHLALPKIESLIDAHLMEALQYSVGTIDVRCLCCSDISADEAKLLAAIAAFSTGDSAEITRQLGSWLPSGSVKRLRARTQEFQNIVQHMGVSIPLRDWDFSELDDRAHLYRECSHINEPSMIH